MQFAPCRESALAILTFGKEAYLGELVGFISNERLRHSDNKIFALESVKTGLFRSKIIRHFITGIFLVLNVYFSF